MEFDDDDDDANLTAEDQERHKGKNQQFEDGAKRFEEEELQQLEMGEGGGRDGGKGRERKKERKKERERNEINF